MKVERVYIQNESSLNKYFQIVEFCLCDYEKKLIKLQLAQCVCKLWRIVETETYFITRAEKIIKQLCLVLATHTNKVLLEDKKYFAEILPIIENIVKDENCTSVRFHTERKAYERYALQLGFQKTVTTYEKAL